MAFNVTCIDGTIVNCTENHTRCLPFKPALIQLCKELGEEEELDYEEFSVFAKIRIIFYIIVFVLSLIGNGSVMLVTIKRIFTKQTVTAFKLLITHLAFVDFLFSCNIFILIPNELYNAEADDGIPMCTFKRLMRQVTFEAAVGNIVVIAVERYIGITRDFSRRKWTLKRVFLSLFIVWIISFLVYLPATLSLKTRRGDVECYEAIEHRHAYSAFLLLAEYVLPLCIIGFCNYKIIKVIKGRKMTNLQVDDYEERDKEQKKTVRILAAIVLGFAILTLPNQIFFAYLDFGNNHKTFTQTWDILQMFGVIMLLHSSFNAAVYSIMDSEFRSDLKEIFCFCLKAKRRASFGTQASRSDLADSSQV